MSALAFLSPSASHRWLACPPSAKLCTKAPDQSSEYARQGTDTHSLCAYLVEKALGMDAANPTPGLEYYDQEMQFCAEGYVSFVLEEYEKARRDCGDAEIMVEQKVDFSHWVKDETSTADCIILSDGTAEVIDFKYGLGVMVNADSEEHGGNPRLMCYCLGVLEMFDGIYDIEMVRLAIYQPHRENVSIHTMGKDELLKWADEVLAPPPRSLQWKGRANSKPVSTASSARSRLSAGNAPNTIWRLPNMTSKCRPNWKTMRLTQSS